MTVEPRVDEAAADPDAGTSELLRRAAEHAIAYREALADRPVRPRSATTTSQPRWAARCRSMARTRPTSSSALAREVPPGLIAMPGPRFFGFVLGGGLPAAVAADWLTSVWDQNSPSAVATPAPAVVERVAGEWLIELFGLPASTSVGFVTGGTMANFMGVAVGRHAALARAGWDVERMGLQGGAPEVTVVAGADAHITLFHAIRMNGLGSGRVRRVDVDDQGRILPSALRETVAAVHGPTIVCLQAGNVNSGAFDPLRRVHRDRPRAEARRLDSRRRRVRALGGGRARRCAAPRRRHRGGRFVVHGLLTSGSTCRSTRA